MTLPLTVEILITGRNRDGGKPAARRLLKPVKLRTKRAAFLRWFLDDPDGRTIGAAMATFRISRSNVFAYWTTINRVHGIGYTLAQNTITAALPENCPAIFRGEA